ncbi:FAD-binding protein [Actinomyces ruminis]|uniref:FAD-dependent oxidoreductase n=1 Tax=Actinomyces ruminis TaxID=1937003 RepID=UPI001C557F17|nr:FAD-binding protein [Actinomyces ruminis]
MPVQSSLHIDGVDVPVLSANTVVVGTGAAGYCAADRLVQYGQEDVLIISDRVTTGSSRNAGSDKQTYYKLTLGGPAGDSVAEMAQTLFDGGAMDGDHALVEAALSSQAFLHLVDLGVAFPRNRYGEFVGYKTDHDPRQRATSVGPYTSRTMVEHLEAKVGRDGTRVVENLRVIDVLVSDDQAVGLLCLRRRVTQAEAATGTSRFLLVRARSIIYATGGPAGMYARSVFPHGQWGATGAAFRAGATGKNLTEWQFGLASIAPRWNVSGSYMQVLPAFVSTDVDGGDEREFLFEAIPDLRRLLSLTFLKGYQWPFDIRKARGGSSLIDLLVYRETVLRGRRVFLDFTRNSGGVQLDPAALDPVAREYLGSAGALFGTPVERLIA